MLEQASGNGAQTNSNSAGTTGYLILYGWRDGSPRATCGEDALSANNAGCSVPCCACPWDDRWVTSSGAAVSFPFPLQPQSYCYAPGQETAIRPRTAQNTTWFPQQKKCFSSVLAAWIYLYANSQTPHAPGISARSSRLRTEFKILL